MLIPAPDFNPDITAAAPVAVLAGGCFWGVQGVFQHVNGVLRALVGYAGGAADSAHYDAVCTGLTGHAEAVEIRFDPGLIRYGDLLQIFFAVTHDPTQQGGQGPDRGPQYRSAIFPRNDEQAHIARAYITQLDSAQMYPAAIATSIEPGHRFYPAEAYHQDYMARHPCQPYIATHDLPKVERLKRLFPQRFCQIPQLVARPAGE